MPYFDGLQIGNKVVCLLYGEGTVTEVASEYSWETTGNER